MADFKLTVQIGADDLQTIILAHENITLVKQLEDAGESVIWTTTPPVANTLFEWEDVYSLFASGTAASVGNVFSVAATQSPAFPQSTYLFSNGSFSGPVTSSGPGPDQYAVENGESEPPWYVFGLMQDIAIAGNEPQPGLLNAETVPAQQISTYTSSENVYVYLNSVVEPGEIANKPRTSTSDKVVESLALVVIFSVGGGAHTVEYNAQNGIFVLKTLIPTFIGFLHSGDKTESRPMYRNLKIRRAASPAYLPNRRVRNQPRKSSHEHCHMEHAGGHGIWREQVENRCQSAVRSRLWN